MFCTKVSKREDIILLAQIKFPINFQKKNIAYKKIKNELKNLLSNKSTCNVLKIFEKKNSKNLDLKVINSRIADLSPKIENIIKNKHNNCFIANDNSPQQIVVSGLKEDLNLFSNDLNEIKIKNIKLNVSAPFHCNLMKSATENMKEKIINLNIKEITNPIVSNYTARPSVSGDEIKKTLILQIEGRVRWLECVEFMISSGTKNFIEIGPGKVLS